MKIYVLYGNDGLVGWNLSVGIYRLEFIGWNLSVPRGERWFKF